MMLNLVNFLDKHAPQLLTIASVILGGVITYFVAINTEKKKVKLLSNKITMEQELIPLCTILEKALAAITEFSKDPSKSINEGDFVSWSKKICEPLRYLASARIIHQSKTMRMMLKEYDNRVQLFQKTIEEEFNEYIDSIEYFFSEKLTGFQGCNIRVPFSRNEIESKLKFSILAKKSVSLKYDIDGVWQTTQDRSDGDYPLDEFFNTSITIDSNSWWIYECTMSQGYCDQLNYQNPEELQTNEFLKHFDSRIKDEDELKESARLLDKTISHYKPSEIANQLKKMIDQLLKEIEEIVNLKG